MRDRLRLLSLLVLGPVVALALVDLAITRSDALWTWVARDFPRRLDDSYRAEGVLRTLPRGRENVLLLGNSRADDSVDTAELERRFAASGRRFHNLTVVGSGVVDAAMRAPAVARVEPGVVLFMLDAAALRDEDVRDETFAYDAAVAARVFPLFEIAADPAFHVDGLASQLHVLARHRSSLQNSLLVLLGRQTFPKLQHELMRRAIRELEDDEPNQMVTWLKRREPDVWPNDNTRALESLVGDLQAADVRLIAVESPAHPILIAPGVAPRVAQFRAGLAEIATRRGFEFLPATELEELDTKHFKDLVHVNERGRALFTRALGDLLDGRL